MEFIDESSEFKKHHYLRNAVIFILLFALASFVCAYFSGDFAPVADALANKLLETANRDASFTFFSDYSNFIRTFKNVEGCSPGKFDSLSKPL